MRAKQRLADIDVAEARDHPLIEQRRLQAGLLVGAGSRQHLRVEFIAERLGAEALQQRLILERVPRDDLHVTEPPGIVEDHIGARRHPKHHVVMRAIVVARMMELAGRLRALVLDDAERAGHAQMHQQHVAGGEIGHQIFGAAAETGHGLAFEARHKILLKGKPQILSPGFGLDDFRAFHGALQAAADGLDFG